VKYRGPALGGGTRVFAAFGGALAALAPACWSASAQLPEPPSSSASRPAWHVAEPAQLQTGPAEELAEQPLPGPAEDVVGESPVAPVRDELRRVVGGSGGGGSGGDSGGAADGSGGASGASGGGNDATVSGSGGRADTDSSFGVSVGSPARRGGASGGGAAAARAEPAGAAAPRARANSPDRGTDRPVPVAARRARTGAAARRGGSEPDGLGRTIGEAVRVIPAGVRIALAALLALALALVARAVAERRRARALEREREQLLRDVGLLERALLPAVPERLGGLSASVAYRPSAGPAAGGDFYDAFELSTGRAAVLVGDVSGHGREALVRSGSVRTKLRACLEAGMSPRAALELAGHELADSSGEFVTVAVGVHDPASGTLAYATAGHPPPILIGPSAHEPVTVASALPLGVGMRTGVRQTEVPLPAGSAACFFTDGLLEARAQGELIGRERLATIVRELGSEQNAEALLDRVISEADETPDDMAACLVRALVGADGAAPRLEELELDGAELGLGIAERFLDACGLAPEAIANALRDARGTAATAGAVVLQVTIDDSGGHVTVEPPASAGPTDRPPRVPPVTAAESP
jgi:serine phosphatase RsbU (regulator of sigma subunit)